MLGHSQTWITYNYICVGVAYFMLAMSLYLSEWELFSSQARSSPSLKRSTICASKARSAPKSNGPNKTSSCKNMRKQVRG